LKYILPCQIHWYPHLVFLMDLHPFCTWSLTCFNTFSMGLTSKEFGGHSIRFALCHIEKLTNTTLNFTKFAYNRTLSNITTQYCRQTSLFSHKTCRLCLQALTITRSMHAIMLVLSTPKPIEIHYLWSRRMRFSKCNIVPLNLTKCFQIQPHVTREIFLKNGMSHNMVHDSPCPRPKISIKYLCLWIAIINNKQMTGVQTHFWCKMNLLSFILGYMLPAMRT